MVVADVPVWVQSVGALAGTSIVAAAIAWERRKKRDDEPAGGPATIVAGTMLGSQTIDRIGAGLEGVTRAITALREDQHADIRRVTSAIETLADEVKRNTAALGEGAATPRDLMQLIHRLKE